jgi:hypothetical protein
VTFHEGTNGSIDNFLGPGLNYGNDYDQQLPSEVDDIGLQYSAHSLNLTHQAILSEVQTGGFVVERQAPRRVAQQREKKPAPVREGEVAEDGENARALG